MLEKMFTTKMSADKKKLQSRFSKIRSKSGRISKFIAMAVFAVIIVSIIIVSVWVAVNRQDDKILYKNETMNFQLEIPVSWSEKYIVDETAVDDNYVAFKHKGISEKHGGMGTLFYVMILPDSEIDEHMNMVGNMTVWWRNQDYGYLIGRPTDVQVPIFADSDEEDFELTRQYDEMYRDISQIESTFSLINDVETPNIANAENLSYAQIRDLQRQADNGHFSWRLDYEQVIMAFLSGKGVNVEDGKITALAGGSAGVSATFSIEEKEYLLELFKPLDMTEQGIWIVKTFQKKGSAIIQEVHFYDRTPAQAWIDKQEDGWYRVPQRINAVLQYEGDKPYSISAYFTQAGTNMESEKKLVGQKVFDTTDTGISQTPARFPSLDLDFSKEDTIGHLWFVFDFEDGSSAVSEIYNMYIE